MKKLCGKYTANLMLKIEENTSNIRVYIKENKRLCVENMELKERLNKIELSQLGNDIIISGMQEQPWESYSTTNEQVYDKIAVAMGGVDQSTALQEARKVDISAAVGWDVTN